MSIAVSTSLKRQRRGRGRSLRLRFRLVGDTLSSDGLAAPRERSSLSCREMMPVESAPEALTCLRRPNHAAASGATVDEEFLAVIPKDTLSCSPAEGLDAIG